MQVALEIFAAAFVIAGVSLFISIQVAAVGRELRARRKRSGAPSPLRSKHLDDTKVSWSGGSIDSSKQG